MKIFGRKATTTPMLVHKSFTKEVAEVLNTHGITNVFDQKLCSLQLIKTTYAFYLKTKKKEDATDEELNKLGKDLCGVLTEYGITEDKEQDALLCDYFDVVNEYGEGKK